VLFANTFTPNGDGVNDTWTIDGIENDYSALIRVYNRYGSLVFENRGQYTPWNGQYQGKRLPPGTYYYIISAKNGKQTFTGSVTILY
jgi:gliding motility-associated-like protein